MKYLITGGTGFIGSFLSEALISDGHEVIILDNTLTGKNKIKGAHFIKGDIRNAKIVRNAVKKVDQVFHLAAAVGVRNCIDRPDYAFETNVIGAHNILKACIEFNRPLLVTSSSAIYGKITKKDVSENDDVHYGSPDKLAWAYSYHKAIEEALAMWYGKKGYPFKVVRLFNCVGRRQVGSYGMVVPRFLSWAKAGKPIVVYGDGKQSRTFGDVRDVVDGIRLVMQKGKNGEAYNLGGKDEININELAKQIKTITDSKSKIVHIPFSKAFDAKFEETMRRRPNLSKISKLGYKPKYSIKQTLNWIAKCHI